jgi:hypothetical protein
LPASVAGLTGNRTKKSYSRKLKRWGLARAHCTRSAPRRNAPEAPAPSVDGSDAVLDDGVLESFDAGHVKADVVLLISPVELSFAI